MAQSPPTVAAPVALPSSRAASQRRHITREQALRRRHRVPRSAAALTDSDDHRRLCRAERPEQPLVRVVHQRARSPSHTGGVHTLPTALRNRRGVAESVRHEALARALAERGVTTTADIHSWTPQSAAPMTDSAWCTTSSVTAGSAMTSTPTASTRPGSPRTGCTPGSLAGRWRPSCMASTACSGRQGPSPITRPSSSTQPSSARANAAHPARRHDRPAWDAALDPPSILSQHEGADHHAHRRDRRDRSRRDQARSTAAASGPRRGCRLADHRREHHHRRRVGRRPPRRRVVVDVADSPSFDDDAVARVLPDLRSQPGDAEASAGVSHHVALSVVGADRLPAAATCAPRSPRKHSSERRASRTRSCGLPSRSN